ncbi:hypothetical protein QOZ95_003367 [Paenibacillus brasilensis]|uniref:Uncharacterized protein n=1 Tax=Paenibacillus brasilensis TaxID=128574 RepID=A0ABU0L322_9BACL|nr:hypothetical protein [Paenibacillus brasilensis]
MSALTGNASVSGERIVCQKQTVNPGGTARHKLRPWNAIAMDSDCDIAAKRYYP